MLSVSELNEQIKSLIESTFLNVNVKGEVVKPTYHSSGHLYFSIKDEHSTIKCVMFRSNANKMNFKIKDGLLININANISLYTPRGEYQLNCLSINEGDKGDLAIKLQKLKEKLKQKGYFDTNRKKTLNKFLNNIAIISSKSGAALQDILSLSKKRFPLSNIYLYDSLMQGNKAINSIIKAIKEADTKNYDCIAIARGGGSLEDLSIFNEEILLDAIFLAKTPIISAIGHESDYLLSDLVADIRAPTPSTCMEMILPDKFDLLMYIDNLMNDLNNIQNNLLKQKEEKLINLKNNLRLNSTQNKIINFENNIKSIKILFDNTINMKLEKLENILNHNKNLFINSLDNIFNIKKEKLENIKKFYELYKENIEENKNYLKLSIGNKLISLDKLKKDDVFYISSSQKKAKAKIIEIKNINENF